MVCLEILAVGVGHDDAGRGWEVAWVMPWQSEKETQEVEESARGGEGLVVTICVDDAQHAQ